MGVHGLWDLLSPVGRRVSVETLTGKRLAIDASIWMVQFMKAMRDEKGEMIRNAHLLGFFRRICKLLYLRTKPVFVFDGGTPALKRRTVIARRRQRENAQAKIRKTAEKLLLNQLKQARLRELTDDLEKQRGKVDKGKKILTEETDVAGSASTGNKSVADSYNQQAIDEMLAASLAAEEDGGFAAGQSSSSLPNSVQDEDADADADEDEDEDEDEEMILPTFEGKIDPAILASLPPSMQLDLLVQMRERLMAENRKKYQRVKKAPARFSELQIQSYLKTVAFRREINEVQKAAAGRGIGGVQTSRIASEANREFIFSSNYKGDKLDLAHTGEGMKTNDSTPSSEKEGMYNKDQSGAPIINTSGSDVNNAPSSEKSSAVSGVSADEPENDPKNDVETYLDERGRVRVSRVRAMGMHMTRDLQRNLDLMKEIEEERVGELINLKNQVDYNGTLNNSSGDQSSPASDENNHGVASENGTKEEALLNAGTTMEISFEGNGPHVCGNEEDDLFSQLVAGNPVLNFSLDNSLSNKQSLDSGSEVEWEEGDIEGEGVALSHKGDPKGKSFQVDELSMEEELEWEEGSLEAREEASSLPIEQEKVSKGALVEETELQEAIRRSLQDLEHRIFVDEPVVGENSRTVEVASCSLDTKFTNKEGDWKGGESPSSLSGIQQSDSLGDIPDNSKGDHIAAERKHVEGAYGDRQIGEISNGDMEVLLVKESPTNLSLHAIDQCADTKCSLEPEIRELDTSVQQNSSCQVQLTHASASGDMVAADGHSNWTAETEKASQKYPVKEVDNTQKVKEMHQRLLNPGEEPLSKVSSSDYRKEDIDVTRANLEAEMQILDEEYKELGDKQRKLERNAESVNSEVFAECQELLQMFGLPYIIAPMEAEAQCAYMELVDIVDGVVTDDSDVLLFGARNVYKNIFDDRKYVETYFMKDIENELGLSREKLVRMAMLLGSDYTEGISGIGIVNAIEVVNAFPEEDGLHKFREWIESPDPSILGGSLKQGESPSSAGDNSQADGNDVRMKRQFMDRHRNVSKNWHIPSSFPSDAVISAYSSPQVDKSTAPFSWGKPDHYVLRKLCWEKFGWNIQKADELLLPVLTEYNKRETQLRMEAFYTFNERFAKIRSKRIKKAVKGITGKASSQLIDESVQDEEGGTSTAKGTKGKGSTKASESENPLSTEGETCQSQSRRGNVKRKSGDKGTGSDKRSSTKRARKKANPSPKPAASCSDDEIVDEREEYSQAASAEPHQTRRSGRPRKEVNYAVDEMELDNPYQDEGTPINQSIAGEEPFSEVIETSVDAPEHFVEGTGFPLDEVRNQDSTCQTTDSVTEGQISEDYLAMGGGFCLDEEGKDEDVQGVSDSDLLNSSILGEEDEETAIPTRVEIDSNISVEQSVNEDDSGKGLLRPLLSAMPNLKRKRRKD